MSANSARVWAAAAVLGLSLAGPQALGTATADSGDHETARASANPGPQRAATSTGAARPTRNAGPVRTSRSAAPRPQTGQASGPTVTTSVPVVAAPAESRAVAVPAAALAVNATRPRVTAAPPLPSATLEPGLTTVVNVTSPTFTRGRRAAPPPAPGAEMVAGAMLLTRRSLSPVPTATSAAQISANPIADFLTDVGVWVDTYANLYQWWSGSLLPNPIRQFFFSATPVADPMQVELDLAAGVTSRAIPFSASDADGHRLVFSVPDQGQPGGPSHGTVSVDNAAGTFTYTPDGDFTGTDTFSFVASDDTSLHFHAWAGLLNAAFGLLGTGLAGGHRTTATVTVFNNVDIRPDPELAVYTDIVGDFSVLTYNVSGLPFPFSGGPFPRITSTLEIGSRLDGFDVVNVQEDIAYHQFLIAGTDFPDRTAPSVPTWAWPVGVPFSDGLNSMSSYYLESLQRQAWSARADLLNPGGFTYTRQHIPGGSSVDVYNVDTSGGALTNDEIAQLSAFIGANSIGRAVIVTGDFGQYYSDPGQTLSAFAAVNGLTDAWVQVEFGGLTPTDAQRCAYADSCEQPDKIFFRDAAPLDPLDPASSPVRLQALDYTNEGLNFLDDAGRDLAANRPQSVNFGYTVDAIGPMNVELSDWMGDLPALSMLPLTQIPIPGTHDSGSYGITPRSPWALTGKDQFGILTELPEFLQDLIVKPIAAGYGKTQSKDIYEQFDDGIRYVDLRLTNEPDGQVYLEHALRSVPFTDVVDDIGAFANEHPREVLVIYVQGIKNFTAETHAAVIAQMDAAFGSRMAPRALGTSATLQDLWAADRNVIVVYNNSAVVAADPELWPDDTLYRPWPQVASVPDLLAGNETNLANRPPEAIWGMFGESTPSPLNYVTGILTLGTRNIEQFMFNVHPPVQQWMRVNFKESLNLVTADWYQEFWPAGSTLARDNIGAVYETLGSRTSAAAL